jgi:hypothetical protein
MPDYFYNDDIVQGLLSAPFRNLKEQAKLLNNKAWLWRYYNGMSWIFGVSDQELIDFKQVYDGVIDEIKERPKLEDKELTNSKIKLTLDKFPRFNPNEFLIGNISSAMFRALLAYFIFPYGIYLFLKSLTKTSKARQTFFEIVTLSDVLINLYETDNTEEWLRLEKESRTTK